MLMYIELEELCDRDRDTNNLNPILDPLAIKTNMINSDDKEINESDVDKRKYKEISSSSKLNNIGIMFFRHQHILKILSKIIVNSNFILEFSTSKVDIL